jgi:glycosyltransferase involved in cell wall biosynthesis
MRKLRDAADFIVYQSGFCKTSAGKFLGPCEIPSAILYNPVAPEIFSPDPQKSFCGAPVRLLAAGTHGTRDRVVSALEALRDLRKNGIEATLTVAGRFQWPDGENDFAREISRLGIQDQVRRIPKFSQSDAPAIFRAHDLLVHPKYMDPCPTVVLEAMASGLPIVGSRSGGMPELVPKDCGVLIDAPADWDVRHTPTGHELAVAIATLLPGLSAAATAARRHAVEHFGVAAWIEAHEVVFRNLKP